jgi:hypothetical protein
MFSLLHCRNRASGTGCDRGKKNMALPLAAEGAARRRCTITVRFGEDIAPE